MADALIETALVLHVFVFWESNKFCSTEKEGS